MFTALLIVQVLMGITIIGLVLLQQGKGADMGAAFGAGASGTVFGAAGGGSFFTRLTAVLAALFFINSLVLSSPLVRDVPSPETSVTRSPRAVEESDVPVVEEEEVVVEEADVRPADAPQEPVEPAPDVPAAAADAPQPDDMPPAEAPAGGEPAKPE